jgi:hypothetical protein
LRTPVIWGLAVGVAQAATPLAFWWLDTATVYAIGLAVIASVYIGFAVADGRRESPSTVAERCAEREQLDFVGLFAM